jgi:hypothetical protein
MKYRGAVLVNLGKVPGRSKWEVMRSFPPLVFHPGITSSRPKMSHFVSFRRPEWSSLVRFPAALERNETQGFEAIRTALMRTDLCTIAGRSRSSSPYLCNALAAQVGALLAE